MKKVKGFSLIELVIVILILGVLMAIMYPSYTAYILKSRRTEAKAGLVMITQRQEDYRATSAGAKYAPSLDTLLRMKPGEEKDGIVYKGGKHLSENEFYEFSLSTDPEEGQFFEAVAIPTDSSTQKDDKCTKFIIDNNGEKRAKPEEEACW